MVLLDDFNEFKGEEYDDKKLYGRYCGTFITPPIKGVSASMYLQSMYG
jgi:hypothetical protein